MGRNRKPIPVIFTLLYRLLAGTTDTTLRDLIYGFLPPHPDGAWSAPLEIVHFLEANKRREAEDAK